MDEVYAIRLTSFFSTLPRVPPDLTLSGIIVTKEESMHGGTSDVFEGRQGGKRVALKVMRIHEAGVTEKIKRVIEVCVGKGGIKCSSANMYVLRKRHSRRIPGSS